MHELTRARRAQLAQQHARVEAAGLLDGVGLQALHEADGGGGELLRQCRELLTVLLRHRTPRRRRRRREPLLARPPTVAASTAAAAAPLLLGGCDVGRGVGGRHHGRDRLDAAAAQHAQHARLDGVGVLGHEARSVVDQVGGVVADDEPLGGAQPRSDLVRLQQQRPARLARVRRLAELDVGGREGGGVLLLRGVGAVLLQRRVVEQADLRGRWEGDGGRWREEMGG